MMDNIKDIRNMLPEEWSDKDLTFTFYVIGNFQGNIELEKYWKINDSICMLLTGSYNIPVSFKTPDSQSPYGFKLSLEILESPYTTWLVFIRDNDHEAVDTLNQKILRGLLYIIAGRNIAYGKYSSFTLLADNRLSYSSEPFLNPSAFPIIDLPRLKNQLTSIEDIISSNSIDIKVRTSLKWYLEAKETSGIDAIIKMWVAFEAIAMSSTNVISSYELLADIYDISKEEIKDKFMLGRILGYRSDLLHGVKDRNFDINLLSYLDNLVADIIIYQISGIKRKLALSFIAENEQHILGVLSSKK